MYLPTRFVKVFNRITSVSFFFLSFPNCGRFKIREIAVENRSYRLYKVNSLARKTL